MMLPINCVEAISKKSKKESEELYRLPNFGNRLMDTPIAALAETRGKIARMAETAKLTFNETMARIEDRDYKKLRNG